MIIDCHGHYTTAPADLQRFRDEQVAHFKDAAAPAPGGLKISDDEIRESIQNNQLKLLKERGADMTIFSPRASAMAPHVGDEAVSKAWTRNCNDLIKRVVDLFPETFIGVCQLPQSPGATLEGSIEELERCVERAGLRRRQPEPGPLGRPLQRRRRSTTATGTRSSRRWWSWTCRR